MALRRPDAAVSRVERGTALAETALVVSFSLVIVLNGFELALIGFNQLHADAAAFVAARVQALSGSSATATSTTNSALPPATSIALSSPSGFSQAIATRTSPGLIMIPGLSGSFTLRGEQLEPLPPAVTSPIFDFSAPNTSIVNYYPQATVGSGAAPSTRAVSLAQAIDAATTADVFHRWRDHQRCLASINFPASYGSTQTAVAGSTYTVDPNTNPWATFPSGSAESQVYGWDGGGTGTC
jgi:hypothetical protein